MKCDAYRVLIAGLEKDELDQDEAELLRRHLDVCENCRAYEEGRRTAAGSTSDGDVLPGEAPYFPEPVARSTGHGWGWAAAAVIGLAALIALILVLGHGRWSHGGMGRHHGEAAHHSVWRQP